MTKTVAGISSITEADVERFREDGFLVVEGLIAAAQVESIRDRFERLFNGEFDTGVYPDEWYWRTGMSLPDVTRHMANLWKSDLTIAGLATSAEIGRTAARPGRLARGAPGSGHPVDETAPMQADLAAPGRLVRRFPRSAGDVDLLGRLG